MSTEANTVRYIFRLDEETLRFEIDTSFEPTWTEANTAGLPAWTRLDCHQCECCPLKSETHPHCPAAVRMHKVLERFKGHGSVQRVALRVETQRRNYELDCDLQSGLNSMLGLQMATSGCPVVSQLRSMATFHLPLSSFAETLYRAVSAYLTKQYFIQQEGGTPDWQLKGLQNFYEALETLNNDFSQRIRMIDQKDAISNAMVMFFAASIVVASLIEDGLSEYKDYFTGLSTEAPE